MLPFTTRSPNISETTALRLLLSTYADGSGTEVGESATRPNWCQLERSVADLLGVQPTGSKDPFDIIAPDDHDEFLYYGLSIKSKKLNKVTFDRLDQDARVYMEVTNSSALLWHILRDVHSIREDDFRNKRFPTQVGSAVLTAIDGLHRASKKKFEKENKDCTLVLENSVYMCFSYTNVAGTDYYRADCFPIVYPEGIIWNYISDSCLRGFDPENSNEALIDWYGLSGGQLKFYPKANRAIFRTGPFSLIRPETITTFSRAVSYFPGMISHVDEVTRARMADRARISSG